MLSTNLLTRLHMHYCYLDILSFFQSQLVDSAVHNDLSEIHTDIFKRFAQKNIINCLKINLSQILEIAGKMLKYRYTGKMQFSLSILDFFLNWFNLCILRMSGNLAEEIPLLKLCIINSEKISRFALIIFTGISFC